MRWHFAVESKNPSGGGGKEFRGVSNSLHDVVGQAIEMVGSSENIFSLVIRPVLEPFVVELESDELATVRDALSVLPPLGSDSSESIKNRALRKIDSATRRSS